MTPQEIQRTMDFILRSQADAFIRMDKLEERWAQWEERRAQWDARMESKMERLDDKIDRISHEIGRLVAENRRHEKRIRKTEKTTGVLKTRSDSMQKLMNIAMRLLAHQSRRLDALEQE